ALGVFRSKRDLHILVAHQPLRLDGGDGVFLDDGSCETLHLHHHCYLSIGPIGQFDVSHDPAVNSTHAHLSGVSQAGHILELRSQPIGSAEQKLLAANQEDPDPQDRECSNDKDSKSKCSGHGLHLSPWDRPPGLSPRINCFTNFSLLFSSSSKL